MPLDRAPAVGLPAPGPGWVSGVERVLPVLLPLHGCAPEDALVASCPLLLHLEQRALAPFGVDSELQVQLPLLEHLHAVPQSVVSSCRFSFPCSSTCMPYPSR